MELKVDSTKCIGCGACVATYPENFDFVGENGTSAVISSENATPDMAEVCPLGAITVEGAEAAPAEESVDEEIAA